MAADVSSLVRILSRYKEEGDGPAGKGDLVTKDLLGNCAVLGSSKELDLDLKVPSGWEKRLDLISGKLYFQRRSSTNSSPSSDPVNRQLQDLNLPPHSTGLPPQPPSPSLRTLDLKLDSFSSSSSDYQSVCTLEKVKSALERAERESRKKQLLQQSDDSPSPTSSSTTVSSIKRRGGSGREEEVGESRRAEDEEGDGSGSLMAAGCPSCLLYVLISKENPRCPRCESAVPFPVFKKPRIDLNSTTPAASSGIYHC